MIYALLAETILCLHFAFLLYAVLGALGVWFFPRTMWLHIPVFLWAGAIMLTGWTCPLTPLENHYRLAAGETGYDSHFIEHYLTAIIYPRGLTRFHQVTLGILVLTWNVILYSLTWYHWRNRNG